MLRSKHEVSSNEGWTYMYMYIRLYVCMVTRSTRQSNITLTFVIDHDTTSFILIIRFIYINSLIFFHSD